jgi:MSHA biogenesis protein MshJ
MKFINDYLEKFGKLSLRERLLVLLVAIVVLYFAFDTALLAPQQKRIKQLNLSSQAHRQEKDALVVQLSVLEADKAKGAVLLQRQRDEIAALQQQIGSAERFYGQGGQHRSGMAVMLRELLSANPNVSLGGLKTQAASIFIAVTEPPKSNTAAQPQGSNTSPASPQTKTAVYRSGVEVSLKGSFPDLLAYLKALEQRSGSLFWSTAQLDVAAYPQAVLKLDIVTLGIEPNVPLN